MQNLDDVPFEKIVDPYGGCWFRAQQSKEHASTTVTHLWAKPSELVVRLSCITLWNSVSLQQYLKAVLLWWQQYMKVLLSESRGQWKPKW